MNWDSFARWFMQTTGHALSTRARASALAVLNELAPDASQAARWVDRMDVAPSYAHDKVIERLLTHTSWFFRERGTLDTLAATLKTRSRRTVRVWSAGCSSGQEPYTLAMILREAGLEPTILGTDLSHPMIQLAEAGIYPSHAVARLDEDVRRRYFETLSNDRVRVIAPLRECVSFRQHNLAARGYSNLGTFDAIVCRNVLIYFEHAQALRVVQDLSAALAPGGALVLAAVEQLIVQLAGIGRRGSGSFPAMIEAPPAPPRSPAPALARVPAPAPVAAPPRAATPTPTPAQARDVAALFALVERGEARAALPELQAAVASAPTEPQVRTILGLAHKQVGELDAAIAALRAARFLSHDDFWLPPYQLGLCLEQAGQLEGAVEAYRHTLRVIDAGGAAGLDYYDQLEAFARTTAISCRRRVADLER